MDLDAPQTDEIIAGATVAVVAVLAAWLLSRRAGPHSRWDTVGVWVILALAGLVWERLASAWALVAGAALVIDRVASRAIPRGSRLVMGGAVAATVAALNQGVPPTLALITYPVAFAAVAVVAASTWRNRPGLAVAMLAIAGAGNYVNVPDTEQVAFVGAGLVVLALVGVVSAGGFARWESLGLAAVLVLASGAMGARGNPEGFWGVVASLTVFGAEPLARLVRPNTRAYAPVLLLVHLAVVAAASRLLPQRDVAEPWITSLVLVPTTTLVLTILPRRRRAVDGGQSSTRAPVGKIAS